MLAACENSAPARTLARVEPEGGPYTAPQDVTLWGTGFQDVPLVQLSSRDRAALRGSYRVELVALPDRETIHDVRVVSEDRLAFTVPAGLRPATYDVVLIPPAGESLVLEDGYVVTVDSKPGSAPRLWFETKADGSGERISEPKLAVGESLELFTVLRNWKNDVVGQDEVVRFSQDVVLGVLSDTNASHTTFDARLPGKTALLGVSDELGLTASAVLEVEGNISDFNLSLEDAPNGEGQAFGGTVSKRSGDELMVYAVVRDSSGRFALNVPASWQVTGEQRTTATAAERISLRLQKKGTTNIVARYLGLPPAALRVDVSAGRAIKLRLDPSSARLRAGGAPRQFVVKGEDAQGQDTDDVGTLRWSIVDGTFGDFEATAGADATLTPRRAGAGRLYIESSYEVALTSGTIEVRPGPVARLGLDPNSLTLSADDDPVQFEAQGFDAFDNVTDDVGTLTWATNGDISFLGELGELEPVTAGTGTITVTSSLGPAATSGTIEITRGELKTISIHPHTWSGKVGDPAQQFSAVGSDGDGNVVPDIGTLSYRIASGDIAAIDEQTGLFTPTVAGEGTIEVTSSYGFQDVSENIVVSPLGATLRISAIRAPSFFWEGERGARVEVDVSSTDANEVVISGIGLSFSSLTANQSSYFKVVADRGNSDRVPAGGTRTLIYHLDVDPALSTLASITVSATGEAFPTLGPPFAFAGSVTTSSRNSLTEPTLELTAPRTPANRLCIGGQVSFAAETDTLLSSSYEWRIAGSTFASGSSASSRTPTAVFSTVGNFLYSATATYFGYANTLFGTPIYVGTVAAEASDTYPTGQIVFSAPSARQVVALASLPRSDLIAINPALPVRQCNNVPVDPSGHNTLTVFSDRGLINPNADVDPQTPGIQLQLTAAGLLDSVPLIAPSSSIEGQTTLYAEYYDATSGTVTAAGDTTFILGGDQQAPAVQWTIPGANCGSACLAPSDTLLFQFSEPMLFSSLSNSRVDVFAGTTCTGSSANVTGSATRSYDPVARVLYVRPAARNGTYAIRVHLPSTMTDAASARNALPALSRCVVFGAIGAADSAAVPQLTAAVPPVFSPDGDGIDDSVTIKVNADAATSYLRVRITRAGKTVWARLAPIALAGEYTFVWDGSDESGRIVHDGIYGYAIQGINRSGAASAALRGYVEVARAVRMVSVRREQ